jgi:hypothetical protein
MGALRDRIEKVANTDFAVLLEGGSGARWKVTFAVDLPPNLT